ncbi:MAG: competence protein ComEA, competence protein ComEA [Candidatus Berkelbacteria bacterium]|nr:competence protein ComEA, competence protein ComEA [Candidatus Berkelbacteria bacterium]
MDIFFKKYQWYIVSGLMVIILAGFGLIWWEKSHRTKLNTENQTIAELRQQNELLRQQLSDQAPKIVAGESANIGDKININTATVEELDSLPNIGPARSADIIAYREQNAGFKTIEEIKNIKGIGDKSFESLKDLITIGE